jgi:hypothetical protein
MLGVAARSVDHDLAVLHQASVDGDHRADHRHDEGPLAKRPRIGRQPVDSMRSQSLSDLAVLLKALGERDDHTRPPATLHQLANRYQGRWPARIERRYRDAPPGQTSSSERTSSRLVVEAIAGPLPVLRPVAIVHPSVMNRQDHVRCLQMLYGELASGSRVRAGGRQRCPSLVAAEEPVGARHAWT